jgi:hypothetical protein
MVVMEMVITSEVEVSADQRVIEVLEKVLGKEAA